MNATNISEIDRFLQTREELSFWAKKFSDLNDDFNNAYIKKYPNVDQVEKLMDEARLALVEWAIEYNKAWEVMK